MDPGDLDPDTPWFLYLTCGTHLLGCGVSTSIWHLPLQRVTQQYAVLLILALMLSLKDCLTLEA